MIYEGQFKVHIIEKDNDVWAITDAALKEFLAGKYPNQEVQLTASDVTIVYHESDIET